MSDSTVIASTYGASLYLFPAVRRPLDRPRLAEILGRYGRTLLPGAGRTPDFIAAQQLSAADAASLAEELRGMGLTVRVVPRGALTTSRRVSQALIGYTLVGVTLFTLTSGAGTALAALEPSALLLALPVLALGALVVLNVGVLMGRGGARLELASDAPQGEDLELADLLQGLHGLAEALPDHVAGPMLEQARALARRARLNPTGEAATALLALADDLRGQADAEDLRGAEALRAQVAQVRRAARELAGRER